MRGPLSLQRNVDLFEAARRYQFGAVALKPAQEIIIRNVASFVGVGGLERSRVREFLHALLDSNPTVFLCNFTELDDVATIELCEYFLSRSPSTPELRAIHTQDPGQIRRGSLVQPEKSPVVSARPSHNPPRPPPPNCPPFLAVLKDLSLTLCDPFLAAAKPLFGHLTGSLTIKSYTEDSLTHEIASALGPHALVVNELHLNLSHYVASKRSRKSAPFPHTLGSGSEELPPQSFACKLLASYVSISTTLSVLDLSSCGLDEECISFIASALSTHSVLNELKVDHNLFGDKGTVYLAKGLKHSMKLERLSLCSCGIGEVGALALSDALCIDSRSGKKGDSSALRSVVIKMEGNTIGEKAFCKLFPNQCVLNPIKIVLVGGGGIGSKTAMVIKFVQGHFITEYDPTIEDSYFTTRMIDGVMFKLDILDTAGQEEYSAMRDQYMRTGEVFSLGYSITSRSSFDEVRTFHEQILRVKDVPDYPKVLVAGKCDLNNDRQVSIAEGMELAKALRCQFFEVSAKTGINVEQVFASLTKQAYEARKLAATGGVPPRKQSFFSKKKNPAPLKVSLPKLFPPAKLFIPQAQNVAPEAAPDLADWSNSACSDWTPNSIEQSTTHCTAIPPSPKSYISTTVPELPAHPNPQRNHPRHRKLFCFESSRQTFASPENVKGPMATETPVVPTATQAPTSTATTSTSTSAPPPAPPTPPITRAVSPPIPGIGGCRGDRYTIRVISGTSNAKLANDVAAQLGIPCTPAIVGKFSDGEIKMQILDCIRGSDMFVIQPTCPPHGDSAIQELILLLHTCRLSSANRVTGVVPYYGYARQDRKSAPRVPISASCVAKQILSADPNRLMFVDLHCGQIQGFFGNTPTDHLSADSVFASKLHEMFHDKVDQVVIVSPDAGGVHRAKLLADMLNIGSMATILKRRVESNKIDSMQLVGDVRGKIAIIYDDIIDTAGTLTTAAELLRSNGAIEVYAAACHGLFSGPAVQRIEASCLKAVFVTDTIPQEENLKRSTKIQVLSIAPMIAEAIKVIHNELSVSALHTGPEGGH
ncbi:phosphoribosylpyrophosphate synthetase [Pelomyxa schiedti]|nr:phosphoribosylpyrophosphate synthetase [Pelomyxa schiedti]